MTAKTKKAIEFIAKQGVARTDEIGEAIGENKDRIAALLSYAVKSGVLVSCRVERPGKKPCNEYRISGGGKPASYWDSPKKETRKQVLPPAPTPADRPQVSVNNSGSTQVVPPATGRAVTDKKPHRKASQPAPGAGDHVTAKAAQNIPENIPGFGYFSDGHVSIFSDGQTINLGPQDAKRLADFLMNCMISNEVNA